VLKIANYELRVTKPVGAGTGCLPQDVQTRIGIRHPAR
jgi:hypothetical protein